MYGKGRIFIATVAILLTERFIFASELSVVFDPSIVEDLKVDAELNVSVALYDNRTVKIEDDEISLLSEPESVLTASFLSNSWECEEHFCNRTIKVVGRFLGFGKVFILKRNLSEEHRKWNKLSPPLNVTVLRENKLINKLFIIFVGTVVSINYINFGCAIELHVIKEVLRRPIGPAVGFVCQFVIMPLVSYGVGYLIFTDPVLRLGLFTFGCSPGGGASNMWTVLLGGNLNLSIAMTFISTVAAFGTIPLWLFTLGHTIIEDSKINIPYGNIMTSLICLVIPIAIGLLIQRFFPKVAARSKKLLAPICIILIIGIIVMASVSHTYIFYMLSWRMVIAANLSVWIGFIAGILASMAFGFSYADVVAVSIETGIQNTGIAFVLLSVSLPHPVADMASVVPVAGSIITPIPLFLVFCYKKLRNCYCRSDSVELQIINSKKDEYRSTTKILDNAEMQEQELENIK